MTVIDEEQGSNEYADMEFVEFLEFLVRIAYVSTIKENAHGKMIDRLTMFLQQLFTLVSFDLT